MQIVIVSDIHLNSYFSKRDKFLNLVKKLKTDILIINGDLYDLHIRPPQEDIIAKIKENEKIKEDEEIEEDEEIGKIKSRKSRRGIVTARFQSPSTKLLF